MIVIPNVENKNGFWEGTVNLKEWNDYFENVIDIKLNVGGDTKVDSLEVFHKESFEYLMKNQKTLLGTILDELFTNYSMLQDEYGYDDEEKDEVMPDLKSVDELKKLLTPQRIHILNVRKDDVVYLGFHFLCTWDEEHDFGVMLANNTIVKMGYGEDAFLNWIAEEHAKN